MKWKIINRRKNFVYDINVSIQRGYTLLKRKGMSSSVIDIFLVWLLD